MTSGSPVTIRNATAEEGGAITGLFSTVFHQTMSPRQWAWKYRMQMHRQLFAAVAVDETGGVVGHVGAIPVAGTDHGKTMQVWQLTDAMVHPEYRGKDLFRGLLRCVGSAIGSISDSAVIYAFAGPESTKIGLKKGILADKSKVNCYRLDNATALPRTFGWSLEEVSFSDRRLAALSMKQSRYIVAFARRDDDYMTWRYALNPFHRYHVAVVKHLYRSVGWLVWRQDDDGIKLIDYCVRASQFGPAVTMLARYAASQNTIRFWAPDSLIADIRLPLIAEDTPICLMLLNTADGALLPDGMDKDYLFTMGDADIY